MQSTHRISSLAAATLLAVLPLRPAVAGGFFVPGAGVQAMARAGAFVAKADDPSALAHNPAGFGFQRGTRLLFGLSLIDHNLRFQRAGVYRASGQATPLPYQGQPFAPVENDARPRVGIGQWQAIPMLVVASDLGLDGPWHVAIGLYAPNAYPNRRFVPDYSFEEPGRPPPPQRYDVNNNEAQVAYAAAAVAYAPNERLSLGLKLGWGYAQIRSDYYQWGLRNPEEWVARDGLFLMQAEDRFVPVWGLGLLYRWRPWLELAAAYEAGQQIDAVGRATAVMGSQVSPPLGKDDFLQPVLDRPRCAGGGTVDALRSCVRLRLPQTASAGARWIWRDAGGAERADLELDVQWEDWSAADTFHSFHDARSALIGNWINDSVIRHEFRDVFSFRLGGAYRTELSGTGLELRAGAAYDTPTAPLSWNRLDVDGAPRFTASTGVALSWQRLRFEVSGGLVLEPDRTVSNCNIARTADDIQPCLQGGRERPLGQRTAPDPVVAGERPGEQLEHPFNAGRYASGYVLFGAAVSTRF
jgi:long-chain fatty acid transport protein